jgi:hypothetical protein
MKQTTILTMLLLLALPNWAQAQDETDPLAETDDPLSEPEGDSFEEPLPDGVGVGPGEDNSDEGAELTVEASAGTAPGTIGLGVSSTLAGAVGGEAEFWVGDKMLITALLGIDFISPDNGDSTTLLLLAGGGFYRLAGGDNTDFMIGGRLDIGFATGQFDTSQINIEVPARVEYRFTDAMSIHFETGLVLGLIGEDGPATAPFGPPDSRVIRLGGGLFGSAGLTLYVL